MLSNDPLLSLQNLLRHPRFEHAADFAAKAAAWLALLYLAAGYLTLPALQVFGNDEVHYYVSVDFQLVEDGRWLNYLLHRFLMSVPLPIWSLLYLGLSWVVFYRLARIATLDQPFGALVASVLVLSTSTLEMSLWPASFVPALGLTCLALVMHARGVRYQVIYIVSGILLFGTIQTPYFALPLLFLPQFLDTSQSVRARSILLFKHMLWWVAGSVVGVMCMSLMLAVLADIWFPQPGAWRQANPIGSFSSLFANLMTVYDRLKFFVARLLFLGGADWSLLPVIVAVALLRVRAARAQVPALLLLSAVIGSFFVFSIPMGAIIQQRSLLAMTVAVLIGLAMLPGRSAAGRVFSAVLLLNFAYHYSAEAQLYLEAHRAETDAYVDRLTELVPGYIPAYSAFALEGTIDPVYREAARFNEPSLMHPIMMALGAREYLDCRIPSRCDRVGMARVPVAMVPFAGGQLELAVDAAGIGILHYRALEPGASPAELQPAQSASTAE
jgi:hypothetical protein